MGDKPPGFCHAPMKPTNCSTMMSGPGVVSAKSCDPIHHLSSFKPAVFFHCLLSHYGSTA